LRRRRIIGQLDDDHIHIVIQRPGRADNWHGNGGKSERIDQLHRP
jgi:hypothetical protein